MKEAVSQCKTLFHAGDSVTILSFRNEANYPASFTDTTICNTWRLTTKDITQVITNSKPITGAEWHYLFDHLPCTIAGYLEQNNTTYQFELNGGAWLTITCADTTVRLGNFNQADEHLFLSTPIEQ